MIPLATAVVGSASIFAGPDDEWVDYLPPIFFIGALLVTAAMLHQRRMFYVNLALTERLQSTNHRLDILHRLALELNKSLDYAATDFLVVITGLWRYQRALQREKVKESAL